MAGIALLAAGLLISGAWLAITIEGGPVRHHATIAGTFAASCLDRLPNPLAPSVYGEAQIRIYRLIRGVIAVFVLM
jgi:hypothetical protein